MAKKDGSKKTEQGKFSAIIFVVVMVVTQVLLVIAIILGTRVIRVLTAEAFTLLWVLLWGCRRELRKGGNELFPELIRSKKPANRIWSVILFASVTVFHIVAMYCYFGYPLPVPFLPRGMRMTQCCTVELLLFLIFIAVYIILPEQMNENMEGAIKTQVTITIAKANGDLDPFSKLSKLLETLDNLTFQTDEITIRREPGQKSDKSKIAIEFTAEKTDYLPITREEKSKLKEEIENKVGKNVAVKFRAATIPQQEKQPQRGEIWQAWEKKWNEEKSEAEKYQVFFRAFQKSYDIAKEKIEKNKNRNFQVKAAFILALTAICLLQIFLIAWYLSGEIAMELSLEQVVLLEGILLLILVLSGLIISKITDVKKYQETWSRHQHFQYLREQEMQNYIMETGDYSGTVNKIKRWQFIKNILAIEQKNVEKFCSNLDDKEKGMMEGVDILKGFK